MARLSVSLALLPVAAVLTMAAGGLSQSAGDESIDWLRSAYSGPVESWPRPVIDAGATFLEFGPLPPRARLEGAAEARARLGARLFEERHLSASRQIACASCHNRELGFGDALKTSFGHDRQRGARNAQSLYTAAFMAPLFWDGRTRTLEEQALMPIANPIEMAAQARRIERWINRQPAYRAAFRAAYGTSQIAMADIARAIADFERTLRPPPSRWDRVFSEGTKILSDEQLRGLHLFRTKARCANCHSGPLLSDQKFHNLGISFYGRKLEDTGRFQVTGDPADVGRFRTPSLRGVTRSAPYMHNGIFPHLAGLVNLYAVGGGSDRRTQSATTKAPPPQPEPLLQKLDLTADERKALVAFLETL